MCIRDRPLDSEIHPFNPDKIKLTAGSTDVGDVGYAAPTLNINIATACIGNVGHSWQMVAQTCSPLAHKGLLTAEMCIRDRRWRRCCRIFLWLLYIL